MKSLFWSSLVFFSLSALADASRCGGDGPNPLGILPEEGRAEMLRTKGEPEEFVVWERKGEILYRNDRGEVRARKLAGDGDRPLTHSPGALARFADEAERFLANVFGNWIFDADIGSGWRHEGRPFVPLFSSSKPGDTVVYAAVSDSSGWQLERLTGQRRQPVCSYLDLFPGLKLATGHHYPFANFYEVRPEADGNFLYTYRINVNDCTVRGWQFLYPLPGAVQAVYTFDHGGAMAAKIDHPTKNLLWMDDETSCRYFDVGNGIPLQPNPALPILATQKGGTGLTLVYLSDEKQSPILESDAPLGDLKASDIYVTGDGRDLYLRTARRPALLHVPLRARHHYRSGGDLE